ncbi:MAG: signal peptidase I [Chloroflexi bacterium]|nr:signal peptidase I [Chloroflexota bacterium]
MACRTFTNLATLTFAALIIAVLGIVLVPWARGFKTMVVTSGSMEPTIALGSAVVLVPVASDQVRDGDIITFSSRGSSGTVTHRVLSTKEIQEKTYFQTKGDANETPDPDLAYSGAVFGKVGAVFPLVGYVLFFLAAAPGKVTMVLFPVFMAVALECRDLAGIWKLRKLKSKPSEEPSVG